MSITTGNKTFPLVVIIECVDFVPVVISGIGSAGPPGLLFFGSDRGRDWCLD